MNAAALFDLTGKVALVTGCDKGIGRAMAVALSEAGADIIGASRTMTRGSEVERAVRESGRVFHPYSVDLADRDSLYHFISEVKKAHPVLDILVNNAGTIQRSPAAEHPDAYWDTVLAVNLDAPFILAREFGSDMISRGRGKVVFTCSMLSYQGGINVPGYTASKSAVAGVVRALANEWSSRGVNVNGIAPGYIATDNTRALRDDPVRSRAILERIPAGRWGTPDDLKGAIIFLCSAAADYVHGTILDVDGGWMAR